MSGKAKVTYSETCGYCGTTVKVEGDSSLLGEVLICPFCVEYPADRAVVKYAVIVEIRDVEGDILV